MGKDVQEPTLDDALLVRMLQRQEERRFAPETLECMRMHTLAGGTWLDVVNDLQREIAIESGFRSSLGIATAVQRMRTAHAKSSQFGTLSVYARANLAENGSLEPGSKWPNVPLRSLDGVAACLADYCAPLTVICAGSWS